jgi:hypothetical protein
MDGEIDPRFVEAWREWLAALATDADSALAAAHVYEQLEAAGRDAWLDALAIDGDALAVPKVALYAPLLSVEMDPVRRARIEEVLAREIGLSPSTRGKVRALRGLLPRGERVAVLVTPVYLEFVKVLLCRYAPDRGFSWVRDDPMSHVRDAPADGATVDGVRVETTPLKVIVEELARAILAARRAGDTLPPALSGYASLFDVEPDGGETAS